MWLLQCIASTTMDEYRLHFDKDQALARRFQPVLIEEPNQVILELELDNSRAQVDLEHKIQLV